MDWIDQDQAFVNVEINPGLHEMQGKNVTL